MIISYLCQRGEIVMMAQAVIDALNIFGLKQDFSLDELKRLYRQSAVIWHPDKGNDPTGEKMKEINAAYEVLTDYLNGKIVFSSSDSYSQRTAYDTSSRTKRTSKINLDNYKKEAVRLLKSYMVNLADYKNHKYYDGIKNYAKRVKDSIKYYEPLINDCETVDELEIICTKADRVLNAHLRVILNYFLGMYPYFKEVDYELDFDLDLDEFLEQIEQLRIETGRAIFKELSDDFYELYAQHSCFEELNRTLSRMIHSTINGIFANPSTKVRQKNKLYREVDELFKQADEEKKRQEEFVEAEIAVGKVGSVILRQRLDKLKNNWNTIYFHEEIDYVLKEVRNIENGTYVQRIRAHLLEKYYQAMNKKENVEVADIITSLLMESLKVLDDCNTGLITYDIVAYLLTVKFEDLEQDRRMVDYVNDKFNVPNTGYVYMTNNAVTSLSSFAYLIKRDSSYEIKAKDQYGEWVVKPKTGADITDRFISLSVFLANAEFVGKKASTLNGDEIYILYVHADNMIALDLRGNIIKIDSNEIDYVREDGEFKFLYKYEDKEKVLKKIADRINEDYSEDRKR